MISVSMLSAEPPSASNPPLSAAQKTFQRLRRQSARLHQEQADWEGIRGQIQQRVLQELLPLQQQFLGLRRDLLLQLDASSQTVRLGKVARATLSQTIATLAQALLEEETVGWADAEASDWPDTLQAIYQRHAPAPEAALEEPLEAALLRQMLAGQGGLSGEEGEAQAGTENDAPESFAAFMDRVLRERLAAQMAELVAEQAAQNGGDPTDGRQPEFDSSSAKIGNFVTPPQHS